MLRSPCIPTVGSTIWRRELRSLRPYKGACVTFKIATIGSLRQIYTGHPLSNKESIEWIHHDGDLHSKTPSVGMQMTNKTWLGMPGPYIQSYTPSSTKPSTHTDESD